MPRANRKIRAARISVATATGLAAIKLVTGLATGSMAILSSAIDSLLDIFMSGVNLLAITKAEKPADKAHPFGHGKYETLATLIQSSIIAISGLVIIGESLRRLYVGSELRGLEGGIFILAFSILASWLISRYLLRVAKETDSSALRADSLHFSMDVYTNGGLLLGLVLIRLFDLPWLDPVLSIAIACYILFEAARLVRHGLRDVLDEELPESIRAEVTRLIRAHGDLHLDFHNLRTRRAGSQKIMDFHLTLCRHLSVHEAHRIADHLEKRIEEEIPGADVTIHIEPCLIEDCDHEFDTCPHREKVLPLIDNFSR
ncbi:cation diffusion facilitator family transporter [Geoalkalibacter halelectricus]|uniref:Cation diffusion facilitator family transporter n=1 Tax=Geoalkalibacter halelectricus TaxID=2847045 RepID=A0ABY5ZQ94_9BACT|nr:cation diffusion facilitator family transporter [Geoalkalibacter halelectricus]MDO3376703.1 cation diffusion facilitator family transporter [Geoalkalibacter halelectricus]UWZ81345.1 cation diffusion facilitator family transporter [Geoalkalibacter halelectricus]